NYFMLERRTQEGGWQEVARTDQFAISGKVSGLQAVPNVQGGVFNEPQTVTLAAPDPNATIIFTTDGTDPQVATGEQGTGGGLPLATVGL
ncbi:chitobiase/beta-hexosaminidase C-terminal domain-containing protein, partial [Escherichia coli]|nr:chitobiase/beta-hexosaminidase C-terminal domain-containing protein [Escherichia coli]